MDPLNRPAGQLALENEPDGRATLRARQTPRSERRKIGKGLRKRVARSSLGDWTPPSDRRDPVDQVNTAIKLFDYACGGDVMIEDLTQALGEAAVEIRVWKKSAEGRLGPSRTSR